MTSIRLYQNKILKVGNALAASDSCCCGIECTCSQILEWFTLISSISATSPAGNYTYEDYDGIGFCRELDGGITDCSSYVIIDPFDCTFQLIIPLTAYPDVAIFNGNLFIDDTNMDKTKPCKCRLTHLRGTAIGVYPPQYVGQEASIVVTDFFDSGDECGGGNGSIPVIP